MLHQDEIVLRLVESLNMGNCCLADDRVAIATLQYNQLVDSGILRDCQKIEEFGGTK